MIFPIRSKSKLTENLYQKYNNHFENFVYIIYYISREHTCIQLKNADSSHFAEFSNYALHQG